MMNICAAMKKLCAKAHLDEQIKLAIASGFSYSQIVGYETVEYQRRMALLASHFHMLQGLNLADNRIKSLEKELEAEKKHSKSEEKRNRELSEFEEKQGQELAKLKRDLEQVRQDLAQAQSDKTSSSQQIIELNNQLSQLKLEKNSLKKEAETEKSAREGMESLVAKLERRKNRIETNLTKRARRTLNRRCQKFEEELYELKGLEPEFVEYAEVSSDERDTGSSGDGGEESDDEERDDDVR